MKRYDATALGELLIDFTENGVSPQGNPLLEANPGGAPCNVLAMLSKLGHKTAFIGKVGNDMFGDRLKTAIEEAGIDSAGLKRDNETNTTLAFVYTLPGGEREFSFYRNPGADMKLCEADIDEELIAGSKIFHFGTLSMTHEKCRQATKKAIEIAEKSGAILSFDPNIRENLWDCMENARRQTAYGMEHCQILKISDNEIQWFTGEKDFDRGAAILKECFGIPLILVSLGSAGSLAFMDGVRAFCPAYINPGTIDATGAGDTFCGCVLHYVLKNGWRKYTKDELEDMLMFANAAASIVTARKGALRVMPSPGEVEAFIKSYDN
ncbi:MAG: carbohydrate kinase [Clostridiales bacterium]|nr:carbohydrate kinase [Clostridiales bacterium]